MKNAHGLALVDHSLAAAAAVAAAVAIVPHQPHRTRPPAAAAGQADPTAPRAVYRPSDLRLAQQSPAELARLVSLGLVQSLGPGLDACRAGDLQTLRRLVQSKE